MKIGGIIAEYNPFHNGHLYQLEQLKKAGATHIAVVMSGNFVQRGDVGIFSKWARTEACLHNGVDLVVELPTVGAMTPAKEFAFAGVSLLKQLGVQIISFGSECGETAELQRVSSCIEQAENNHLMQKYLKLGFSYPQAREQTVLELFGQNTVEILRTPNNLLGIEYLRAAEKLSVSFEVHTILRKGALHDGIGKGQITSASHLRKIILESGLHVVSDYLPQSAYEIYEREVSCKRAPCTIERLSPALHYLLRSVSVQDLSRIQDVAEGLENRILRESREWGSVEDLVGRICSKRYTRARVRRILMNLLLNIQKDSCCKTPEYLRVLGTNRRGQEILQRLKMRNIPYFMKFSAVHQLGFSQAVLETRATDIYSLSMPKPSAIGAEFTSNPIILTSLG